MKKRSKTIFIQLGFLLLLFLAAVVSIFHITGAYRQQLLGIFTTDGLFNIDQNTAGLISEYVLFGTLIIYNIFMIYLILNQKE